MERAPLLVGAASASPDRSFALAPEPGRVLGLVGGPGSGMTRLALSLLAAVPGPVAVVDVRGWICPLAAWEAGITPDRLVVVRCPDRGDWSRVTASLLEGFPLVYAEAPARIADPDLRRLVALARARSAALILRPVGGGLPAGLVHLLLEAEAVHWEGVERGHGALVRRRLLLRASGRGARGMEQVVEVEDDGTHPLRVVSRLGAAPAGRAAG